MDLSYMAGIGLYRRRDEWRARRFGPTRKKGPAQPIRAIGISGPAGATRHRRCYYTSSETVVPIGPRRENEPLVAGLKCQNGGN